MKCCMCKKEIVGMGHNAAPLTINRSNVCCDKCNEIIINLRMLSILSSKENRSRNKKATP